MLLPSYSGVNFIEHYATDQISVGLGAQDVKHFPVFHEMFRASDKVSVKQ